MRFLILFSLLAACTIRPPDVFVFEHLGQRLSVDPVTGHLVLTPSTTCMIEIGEPECGHGVKIVSGKEIFVGEIDVHFFNGKPWSKLRSESIYLPAVESYAPIATYIINSCKKMNCSKDVTRFKVKLDSLNNVRDVAPVLQP